MISKLGDRHNDYELSAAGRYKFMELFYGFNHPIYQEIEFRDLRQQILMPEEVLEQRNQNITYSTSRKAGKNQGGDFVLEGNYFSVSFNITVILF